MLNYYFKCLYPYFHPLDKEMSLYKQNIFKKFALNYFINASIYFPLPVFLQTLVALIIKRLPMEFHMRILMKFLPTRDHGCKVSFLTGCNCPQYVKPELTYFKDLHIYDLFTQIFSLPIHTVSF